MKTREDYDRALDVIGSVIKTWDPYLLLADGEPRDEFDMEIARLVTRIRHIHSAGDAAREVSAVFGDCFSSEEFPVQSCADVGAKLFHALASAHLLSKAEA